MKRGRPLGTGKPLGRRTTCRYCHGKLTEDDPYRDTPYGRVHAGECRACYSKRTVIKNWKRRGLDAIKSRLGQLAYERELLEQLLAEMEEDNR